MSDIRVLVPGGGGPELARSEIPERGLYARHACGVMARNLDVTTCRPDARPVLMAERVEGLLQDGVRLNGAAAGG